MAHHSHRPAVGGVALGLLLFMPGRRAGGPADVIEAPPSVLTGFVSGAGRSER
ncbi:hypothetical protein [Microvirga roseola]|uniref:hypothetical protein n=1 Tax=Microvirga roseola TaxID=2883126 RepID=UPI001E2FA93E|nr:hypothetical protein [Microvirga roseola]